MEPQERFARGVAVVTGAGAGIGEGLATTLGGYGMHVVVADIDGERATRVAERITAAGGSATPRAVDVADWSAVDALADELFAQHGHVDLLINNAGLESAGMTWEIDPARWGQVMRVNVDGVFHGVRAFVPRMLETQRSATVANLSSVGGIGIVPFQSPYVTSKHAVQAMTECLRQELDLVGAPIQVSVVVPYYVRSRIFVDAHAVAPSENPLVNAYFARMDATGSDAAPSAEEAAEHMLRGIAAGDFWVFSDDAAGRRYLAVRAEQLHGVQPPPDPRPRLREMGIDL